MDIYEHVIRKKIIPVLEKMTRDIDLWERKWEDCFITGMTDFGLPIGVYEITIVRTGEVTIQNLTYPRVSFSLFDDRIKKIYSKLEKLESIIVDKKKSITKFL